MSFQFFQGSSVGKKEGGPTISIQVYRSWKLATRSKEYLVIDECISRSEEGAIAYEIWSSRMGNKKEKRSWFLQVNFTNVGKYVVVEALPKVWISYPEVKRILVVDYILEFIDARFIGAGAVPYSPAKSFLTIAVI